MLEHFAIALAAHGVYSGLEAREYDARVKGNENRHRQWRFNRHDRRRQRQTILGARVPAVK